MGKPEQMDRFPTVRQLRVQADLLQLEGPPIEGSGCDLSGR
jgi:hypothetical protein